MQYFYFSEKFKNFIATKQIQAISINFHYDWEIIPKAFMKIFRCYVSLKNLFLYTNNCNQYQIFVIQFIMPKSIFTPVNDSEHSLHTQHKYKHLIYIVKINLKSNQELQ